MKNNKKMNVNEVRMKNKKKIELTLSEEESLESCTSILYNCILLLGVRFLKDS